MDATTFREPSAGNAIRGKNRGGERNWQVDYGIRGGTRVQRSFKTQELARADVHFDLRYVNIGGEVAIV